MTTTQNTKIRSFNIGQVDANSFNTLKSIMDHPLDSTIDGKAWMRGVLAGLSMRLGRLQQEMDDILDGGGEDSETEALESPMADLYALIEAFAIAY